MNGFNSGTGKRFKAALTSCVAGIGVVASSLAFAQLLGVDPGVPKILTQSYNGNATSYTSFTQRFTVTADAVNYLDPPGVGYVFIQDSTSDGPRSIKIDIEVDNAGVLVGGSPSDDLIVKGKIVPLAADGVLLTGEILAFGFQNGGKTDVYDFRFRPTGGLLIADYANSDIGVTLVSENSSFNNYFTQNFRGRAKANVGPVEPTPDIDIEKYTNGQGADNPNGGNPDGDAPQVVPGGLVTWEYVITNTGSEALVNVNVSDDQGVVLTCDPIPVPFLPGDSFSCTATGVAEDTTSTGYTTVPGTCGSIPNTPMYENYGLVSANGEVSGEFVEDDDPSHYCNPPPGCELTIEKTCALPPPPTTGNDAKCQSKLQSFTMEWDGALGTAISMASGGGSNNSGGSVNPGDVVTFTGPFSSNDVVVNVDGGTSKFHVSCSDEDMDGWTDTNRDQQQLPGETRDCGKNQGDGKHTAGAGGINDWLLVGFTDAAGDVLNCGAVNPTPGDTECVILPTEVSCATQGKPDVMTFVYTGGQCPGSNGQGNKSVCTGTNDGQPVDVILDGGTIPGVALGESFEVPRTGNETSVILSNAGGDQNNDFHTSCSQPLRAGDSFGAMTLVAFDGVGTGSDVEYGYKVTNIGTSTIDNVVVTDDKLGLIGTIPSLLDGESQTLTKSAFIAQTTVNIASVTGDGPGGANCPASDPVTVTVPPVPPVGQKCDGKLKQFTLIWNGADNTAMSTDGTTGDVENDHPDGFVDKGDEVTFSHINGGEFTTNDIYVDVGAGYSRFHVSCSDHDMDGDSTTNFDSDQISASGRDCGKRQGDGKGNGKSGPDQNAINDWLLEGFIDASDDVLDCTP